MYETKKGINSFFNTLKRNYKSELSDALKKNKPTIPE